MNPSQNPRRATITGMGIVSPIGNGVKNYWKSLLGSANGIDKITLYDATSHKCKIAAEVKDWEAERNNHLSEKQIKYYSRTTQFAVAAAKLALADAKISSMPEKTDVLLGVGAEGHLEIRNEILRLPEGLETFSNQVDPTLALKAMVFAPSAAVALELQTKGRVETISSACNSAFSSINRAAESIKYGLADIVICGGAEAPINWLMMSALTGARMLTFSEDTEGALRPMDKNRDKSTAGEGAGVFILESHEHAVKRGARIYGEVDGYSQAQENINELFMSDRTGDNWANVMTKATNGEKIDIINAHAPSDKGLDLLEANAIKKSIGEGSKRIGVVSLKASIGSALAATGALQTAASLLMLYHQKALGTRNYSFKDKKLNLRVISRPRGKKIKTIAQNAKALGGADSTMILRSVM